MPSAFYRMVPDVAKGGGVINSKGSGSKTTVAANTVVDMPFEDVSTLNGWVNCGLVGTTAQRPYNTNLNTSYVDTTLSKVIFSNGRGGWHDPFTGGLV